MIPAEFPGLANLARRTGHEPASVEIQDSLNEPNSECKSFSDNTIKNVEADPEPVWMAVVRRALNPETGGFAAEDETKARPTRKSRELLNVA